MSSVCAVNLTAITLIVPRVLLLALLRFAVGCPGLCDRELSGIIRFSQVISRKASASDCGLLLCCCTLWHSDRPIQQASDHCRFPGPDQVRTCVRSHHRENGDGSSLVTPVARDHPMKVPTQPAAPRTLRTLRSLALLMLRCFLRLLRTIRVLRCMCRFCHAPLSQRLAR